MVGDGTCKTVDTEDPHSHITTHCHSKEVIKTVLKGVKAKVTKSSVTCWSYPSKKGVPYRLTKKTFKNYCPLCKRSGTLRFNPKKTPEGELTCKACDADYCSVTGWDKAYKPRAKLKPANNKTASSVTQSQYCDMTKAQAKRRAAKLLDTKPERKFSISLPLMTEVRPGDFININSVEGFSNGNYFIDAVNEDYDSGVMELELLKSTHNYGMPYENQYIIINSKGGIVASSSKNPYKAKTTTVNNSIGIKANSKIEKQIMLKGKKLGSIKKIYKWLRCGSGTGGWKYKNYLGHYYKSKSENKVCTKSLEKCWANRKGNCVDMAYIFQIMCKGIGVNMSIVRTKYTSLGGKKQGSHMYNQYKKTGKFYDASGVSNVTPALKKIEKIK